MPGAVITVPSRFTATSVPSGNTVSRWAETTTVGPCPVPGRSAITFPSASMRTFTSPSASSRRLYSAARAASLNGGAGTSQMEACCSSVQSFVALSDASACRTFGCSAGTAGARPAAAGRWAASGTAASSARPADAIWGRRRMIEAEVRDVTTGARRGSYPSDRLASTRTRGPGA